MNNHSKRPKSGADKMFDLIMVLVILIVTGLGAYTVYGKISSNVEKKAIESGTAEQNVKYAADQKGMTVDEFLAEYGLADSDVKAKTSVSDMLNKMTVENYAKYNDKELDAFLDENGLKDKVDKDTKWEDAEKLIPLGKYVGGDDAFAQMKEAYELDDSITAETPWGEAKDKVMEAAKKYQEKMQNATPAPSAEATDAPAEESPAAEATDAPAAETDKSAE